MTDYARASLTLEYSANSDYGDPKIKPPKWVAELTPDEGFFERPDAETSSGVTINTSKLNTVTSFAVKNTDVSNYVTLTFRSAGNGSTDNIVRIAAGGIFYTQDLTAATNPTIIANTATCKCEVFYTGT